MGSPDNNGLETLERFAESALTYDGGMVPPLDCGGLPEELRPLGCRLNELADALGAAIDRELRVTRAALTDALTGAGNRACFNQDVDVLWDAGSRFCIAFIDLDNLKVCNDRCGHAAGDRFIQTASHYLGDCLRADEGEKLYRVGGDEFVIVSPISSPDELGDRLEAVREGLMANEQSPDGSLAFTFSYGCSVIDPVRGGKRRQLTLDLDRRMYVYKLAHRRREVTGGAGRALTAGDIFDDRIFQTLSLCMKGRYFFVHDIATNQSRWSVNAVRDLALPGENVPNAIDVFAGLAHPEDRDAWLSDVIDLCEGRTQRCSVQYRMRDASGRYAMCEIRGYRLNGSEDEPALFVGIISNYSIADMADPSSALPDVRALISCIEECRISGASAGLIMIKLEDFERYNSVYGYAVGDGILAETAARLVSLLRGRAKVFRYRGARFCVVAEGADQKTTSELADAIRHRLFSPLEVKDKLLRVPAVVVSRHHSVVSAGTFSVLSDLRDLCESQSKEGELPVRRAAVGDVAVEENIDPLTGLWRSNEFLRRSNLYCAGAGSQKCCLVKIDIGNMHIFNEWHGQGRGNELLAAVGATLARAERAGNGVAGFWGNDDFTLLCPNEWTLIDDVFLRLCEVIASFDDSVGFTPSLGVYPLEERAEIGIDEYSKATFACTAAKRDYENHVKYFQPVEYARERGEHLLLSKFQYAVTEGRIMFYLQPQVEIETGRIIGAEALARWRHKDGSVTSPGQFMDVLEKSGFVVTLDKAVWRSLMERLRIWMDAGGRTVSVAINLSRVDIASFDVVEYLSSQVEELRIPSELIRVEITESAFAEDEKGVAALVARFHQKGFHVHMDDFGTGRSSLAMLSDVNVDAIKLDRSFLPNGSVNDEKSAGIVRSVASMARTLDVPVIVEGIETEEQEKLVCSVGLGIAQGFKYYRPMPPEDFEALLG